MNSRTDAVEALSVHLRERVRFVRAGLLKITDRRGFNHVAHQEALDGLVLRNEAARGFAEDALNLFDGNESENKTVSHPFTFTFASAFAISVFKFSRLQASSFKVTRRGKPHSRVLDKS